MRLSDVVTVAVRHSLGQGWKLGRIGGKALTSGEYDIYAEAQWRYIWWISSPRIVLACYCGESNCVLVQTAHMVGLPCHLLCSPAYPST